MDTTLRGALIEFKNSIYNPKFYSEVKNKTFTNIYSYMMRMTLVITFIFLLYIFFDTFIEVAPSMYLLMFTVGLLLAGIAVFVVTFAAWMLFGWSFGIVLWILTAAFTKTSIETAVKQGHYASGISMLFMPFLKELHPGPWVMFGLPVFIFVINSIFYKKIFT